MEEVWKPVKGYEGLYEVSNKGYVRSIDRSVVQSNGVTMFYPGKLLKFGSNKWGYLQITMSKNGKTKRRNAHRIVAENFIGNPENKKEVNHKSGDKRDNSVSNLEWCTRSENVLHAYNNGIMCSKGSRNGRAKLNDNKVRKIKRMLNKGCSYSEIEEKFQISKVTVSNIKNGQRWGHI